MYGLGDYEHRVLWTLPPRVRNIVVTEIADGDPESLWEMSKLLRAKDPARTIAREYAREMDETIREINGIIARGEDLEAGMEGLKKRLKKKFKKAVKKVTGAIKKVTKTVTRISEKAQKSIRAVARKIPGAKAVTRTAKTIRRQVKRAGGAVQRIAKTAARKAAPVLGSFPPTSWTLAIKSIRKSTAKFWKGPYGSVVVSVAGAALAPFTFGLSAVAAAAVVTSRKLYVQRKELKAAEKAGKAEAAQMAAQVAEQEADLNRQADEVYNSAQGTFAAIGLTPSAWATLSIDEKIRVIESLSKGQVPSGYQILPEVIDQAQAQGQTITDPSQVTGFASGPGSQAPTPEEIEAPVGTYELYVEGQKVAQAASIQEITSAIESKTSPGDRFEVFVNGKSTGLKIRIPGGAMSVPPEQEAQVRGASRAEIRALVSKAKAETETTGFPWWLIGVPIVAIAAAS